MSSDGGGVDPADLEATFLGIMLLGWNRLPA
jgi:hypothetical protein